jgi:hypothetical protein
VFFNGILGAPAAILRFAFDDAGYYRRTIATPINFVEAARLDD